MSNPAYFCLENKEFLLCGMQYFLSGQKKEKAR